MALVVNRLGAAVSNHSLSNHIGGKRLGVTGIGVDGMHTANCFRRIGCKVQHNLVGAGPRGRVPHFRMPGQDQFLLARDVSGLLTLRLKVAMVKMEIPI